MKWPKPSNQMTPQERQRFLKAYDREHQCCPRCDSTIMDRDENPQPPPRIKGEYRNNALVRCFICNWNGLANDLLPLRWYEDHLEEKVEATGTN